MKTLTFFLVVAFFSHFISKAQTAEVLFVNNNSGSGAASLNLEIRVMPDDTVYTLFSGVNYHDASTVITVPANVILKLNYRESGSSIVYYSVTNIVLNPGEFRILFLYGTGTSKAYSSFTGYKQSSSSSVIKFDFRHSTPTLQEIDLRIRETSKVLADNFVYTDITFGFDDEFNAADYTLDITPFDNNTNGLFAYQLPGSTLGGEYIFLFTSGTGSTNDMYMVQMNGTVTKLTPTAPYVGINELISRDKVIQIYPNPAENVITISSPHVFLNLLAVTIYNLNGQQILTSKSNIIDVENLESGIYCVETIVNQTNYYQKLLILK